MEIGGIPAAALISKVPVTNISRQAVPPVLPVGIKGI
jgi:hypothetical protein